MLPMPPPAAWQKVITHNMIHEFSSSIFTFLYFVQPCIFYPRTALEVINLSHTNVNMNQGIIHPHYKYIIIKFINYIAKTCFSIFSSPCRTTWGQIYNLLGLFDYIRSCPRCSQNCKLLQITLKSCSPRVTGKMRNWTPYKITIYIYISVFRLWFKIDYHYTTQPKAKNHYIYNL